MALVWMELRLEWVGRVILFEYGGSCDIHYSSGHRAKHWSVRLFDSVLRALSRPLPFFILVFLGPQHSHYIRDTRKVESRKKSK